MRWSNLQLLRAIMRFSCLHIYTNISSINSITSNLSGQSDELMWKCLNVLLNTLIRDNERSGLYYCSCLKLKCLPGKKKLSILWMRWMHLRNDEHAESEQLVQRQIAGHSTANQFYRTSSERSSEWSRREPGNIKPYVLFSDLKTVLIVWKILLNEYT